MAHALVLPFRRRDSRSAALQAWRQRIGGVSLFARAESAVTPEAVGLSTVVGVYEDVRSTGLTAQPSPEMILPLPPVAMFTGCVRNETVVVSTAASPESSIASLRAASAEIDPQWPSNRPPRSRLYFARARHASGSWPRS